MYTDLTNKLNTGIKSRFTGFGPVEGTGAPAAETKTLVGSAFKSLAKALDRLGVYPVVDDSLFGLNAYIAGDFGPNEMTREARRLARASMASIGRADVLAKAYLGYDYFDFLADHGYLAPTAAQGSIPTAARVEAPRAALQPAA
jgi:hypothetical protein